MLDIYVWMLSQWQDAAWLEASCPKIVRLADTVKVRPRIAPIHALQLLAEIPYSELKRAMRRRARKGRGYRRAGPDDLEGVDPT